MSYVVVGRKIVIENHSCHSIEWKTKQVVWMPTKTNQHLHWRHCFYLIAKIILNEQLGSIPIRPTFRPKIVSKVISFSTFFLICNLLGKQKCFLEPLCYQKMFSGTSSIKWFLHTCASFKIYTLDEKVTNPNWDSMLFFSNLLFKLKYDKR